jgi:hypothetical protein
MTKTYLFKICLLLILGLATSSCNKDDKKGGGPGNFDCPIIVSVDSLHLRVREIVVLPGSGTPPYTYSIDSLPFDNNPIKEDLHFGPHFVYVEDAMGHRSERFDFILEPPKLIPPVNFETGPYIVNWEELKGTQWKLYSIDHNKRGRIELEPKDCEDCYTFTFDKDEIGWFFSGVSILNTVNIRIGYVENREVVEVLITEKDEPFDGNLFCSTLKLVEITACDGRFWDLLFNDCGGFGETGGSASCNGVILLKRIE